MTVALLNLAGLLLTVASAFLMKYFPARVAYFAEEGAQIMQWTNPPRPEMARIGK